MACRLCKVIKLPNEYPPYNVSKDCFHPVLYCLRCTVKSVQDHSKCPDPNCKQAANIKDPALKFFQAILNAMFREYTVTDVAAFHVQAKQGVPERLNINLLTGENIVVPFASDMKILDLKQLIKNKLEHDENKQKLIYKEMELTDYMENGSKATLNDFKVPANATIMLMVLLFAIPESFNHVVFDLHWGYPSDGMDFLDATCLIFKGTEFNQRADYLYRNPCSAIEHSGDKMDDINRIGHHMINVYLKQLPSDITHLFFTLSAWRSPNISRYPNPSLKFYEADRPNTDLCKTEFTHAGPYQAVVMCSLSRGKTDRWEIFESGKVSAGNARNYRPLVTTIQTLISQGC